MNSRELPFLSGKHIAINETIQMIQRGLSEMAITIKEIAPVGVLSTAATLFQVASLGALLPLIYVLFLANAGGSGKIQMIIEILPNGDLPIHIFLIMAIIAFSALSGVCTYFASRLETNLVEKAEKEISCKIYAQMLANGQNYFDETPASKSAAIIRRVPSQTAKLVTFLAKHIRSSLSLVIYSLCLVFISWHLTFLVLCALGLFFLIFGRFSDRLEEVDSQIDDAIDSAFDRAHDTLSNISLVRHAQTQNQELRQWSTIADGISDTSAERNRLANLREPVTKVSTTIFLLIIIAGVSFFDNSDITDKATNYLLFFLFFRRVTLNFGSMLKIRGEWKKIDDNLKNYYVLVDETLKSGIHSGTRELESGPVQICTNSLMFSYRENHPTLQDVNLIIPKSRITAIVGTSGAGKSTFIKLLLREHEVESGQLFFNGHCITEYRTDSLLQEIAYINGDVALFNSTIAYNLQYGNGNVGQEDIALALQAAQFSEVAAKFPEGLETNVGENGCLLSSGERQRIGLARMFLRNGVKLYLLDEALSALDIESENRVIDHLQLLTEATTIMVTHRLSSIRNDMYVVVFDKGTVAEHGNYTDLINNSGHFQRMNAIAHSVHP